MGLNMYVRYNCEHLWGKVIICDQKRGVKFVRYIHKFVITVIVITKFDCALFVLIKTDCTLFLLIKIKTR